LIKLIICLTLGLPLGLLLGSYAACAGYRLPRKISTWGRSSCVNCSHTLGAIDLIPVLGYLIRGGKCHYCGKKISPYYTIIEIISAIVTTCLLWVWGPTPVFVKYICLTTGLLTAFVSDMQKNLIPDKLTLTLAILAFPLTLWAGDINIENSLVGGVLGLTIYLLPWVISRQLPGGGDIKLLGVIGLYLGPTGLLLSIIGSSIVAIAHNGTGNLKKTVPMAPYLFAGSILAIFF